APAQAFVDFAANALSLDGTSLGVANGGTGKPKAFGSGAVYYKVTFDICALAKSITLALTNGAIQVWGYQLDPAQQPPDFTAAFTDFGNRQINIVCLSSDSSPDDITALRNHVESSVPIRLTQTPARCRVRPYAGIKVGIGRRLNTACDAEQRAERVEWVETPVEAEGELIEVGLEMLRAHAVVDAVEPGPQIGEDEVDHRHELFGNFGVAALGNCMVVVAPLA